MRKILIIAILAVLIFATACRRGSQSGTPVETNANAVYHAVLLSNGSVYFGKLEGLGTPYPVLKDVYYVQSNVDQGTKAVANVLVKRGKEWHGPDRMILNERAIVFVEPVGPDSKVAQLIAESKR